MNNMTREQTRKLANTTGKVIMVLAAVAAYRTGAAYMKGGISGKTMLAGMASAWITGRILGYALRGDLEKDMNFIADEAYESYG